MLTFYGKQRGGFCDGVSRRQFLQVGALAAGGLTLADMFRSDALAGSNGRPLNVINIYLSGGPTHMDTFDLKPDAPAEFRGEFNPIATNVPGMDICEHFPKLSQMGDKFAIVRSLTGVNNEHASSQSDSGWQENNLRNLGGRPGVGAVISKTQGAVNGAVPSFMSLNGFGRPGFLGSVHGAYRPDGTGRANLKLHSSVSMDRLQDRRSLLTGLDRMRSSLDRSGSMDAIDSFTQRAINVITSPELSDALDVNKEDPRTIDRYGFRKGGRHGSNTSFLVARRLIEVGCRCVSFSWGGWDTHGNNFGLLRDQLPALDDGLGTLIDDLDARGMLDNTLIMMSGEFGRTPRINASAGRDHWPKASFFFLAGGGLRTGQVIGSTNRLGEEAKDRPVHLQQVFATVYRQLGIDIDGTQLIDPNGRPQYLLDNREPIAELI